MDTEQLPWHRDPLVWLVAAATALPFAWLTAVSVANAAVFDAALTPGQLDAAGRIGLAAVLVGLAAVVALRDRPPSTPWWRAFFPDDPILAVELLPTLALFGGYAVLVLAWLFILGGAARMLALQDTGWWERALLVLPVPAVTAACEEFLWRGRILGEWVRRETPVRDAVLWTAGWWALSRGALADPLQGIWLFAAGCVLGWYRSRTGRLLPGVATRLVVDVIMNAAWLLGW